eukprot:SAG22_NODE_183_length_16031_cov_36.647000_11_plen_303_part_00
MRTVAAGRGSCRLPGECHAHAVGSLQPELQLQPEGERQQKGPERGSPPRLGRRESGKRRGKREGASEMVPLLTREQIAEFKRDGFLVMKSVLDPALCAQVRDEMWGQIHENIPRMRRDDPRTWYVTDEESARLTKDGGKDPYFSAKGSVMTIRNGTEQLVLDTAVRPMWAVAEQLLGAGTITACNGEDANGMTDGPCFISDDTVENLQSHMGDTAAWELESSVSRRAAPFETIPSLPLPKTGPVWLTGQGTRGHYLTLPAAKPADWKLGGHSDGPVYGSWRLQMMAYFDDCPPDSGAFTVSV